MRSNSKLSAKNKKKVFRKDGKRLFYFVAILVVVVIFCSFSAVAETTYVINDADSTIIHNSRFEDVARAVAEAGIVVESPDEIVSSTCEETGRVNVEILRAARVLVIHDGEDEITKTQCETVGELLREMDVRTGKNRRISHDLDEKVTDGMCITVNSISYYERTETEEAPFKTMYVYDSSMEEDEEFTIIPGVHGVKEVIYEVTLVDGVEESRTALSETVIIEPVDALVSTGDKSEATLGEPTEEGNLLATNGSTYTYSKIVPMIATAYTHSGYLTATGVPPRVGIVAADTSVLPFGTLVYITARDGSWTYGYAVVGDTGVKGHILDLFMDTYDECIQFGARKANVYVIDRP